jgi:hypothetical protein
MSRDWRTSTAALLNAGVNTVTLFVALVLIGPAALMERDSLVRLAITNPAPIIVQDVLKILSAALSVVLIVGLRTRVAGWHPRRVQVAGWSAFGAVACLLANATTSLFATSQARAWAAGVGAPPPHVGLLIMIFALGAIILNAPWYIVVNWAALKTGSLPRLACYVGIAMGALSFLPPLGLLVLLLSIGWSIGVGLSLRRTPVT